MIIAADTLLPRLKTCTPKRPERERVSASHPQRSVTFRSVTWKAHKARRRIAVRASEPEVLVDQDFVNELNQVSNRTLEVLTSGSEEAAGRLSQELQEMRGYLEEADDPASSRFLRVLQGFLDHTVSKEMAELGGMYSRAADRILNQVAGSAWELKEEGAAPFQEPQFSTWEDVANGIKAGSDGSAKKARDTTYYSLLEVQPSAEPGEIKVAYRRLALKLHPDVNDSPDATARFAEVSNAYDVLSDPTSRDLYDRYGPGVHEQPGGAAGRGNAREAWDEFKPFKRENKRTRARAATRTEEGNSAEAEEGTREGGSNGPVASGPQVGDIVEYPLREIETQDFDDGRTHGLGLLVSRNMDRGDAGKLPENQLDLCEIESLRQEEPDSDRWIADDLGIPSFARLPDLTVVPAKSYDPRYGVWIIQAELSPGCGGPPLPEEIIL